MRVCDVDGCDRKHYSRGWCKSHYERWRKFGSVENNRTPLGEPHEYFKRVVLSCVQDECLIWPYGSGNGYGKLKLNGCSHSVHRLACEIVHGPPPTEDHEAAHNCGNSMCCNPQHVRWATHKENQADRIEHGTDVRGEKHPLSKLTQDDVIRIRQLRGQQTQASVAEQFDISRTQVRYIQSGKSWAWL